MILAGDARPGNKLLYNNEPYIVIDITFVKPGKGGAYARTKMKNLLTNLTREITFRTEEKLDQPSLEYRNGQFLYVDGNRYTFMDQENFEEIYLDKDQLDNVLFFLKEQEVYTILIWDEKVIGITPPIHMIMEVIDTPPGVRGDTAQGAANKPATLDTGLVIQVPIFVSSGDKIKVDTRTNEYIERIKK